ncbi:WYL domain-containing protein [Brachybacterium huguangmaarense]
MTIGSRRRITREVLFAVIPDYAQAPSVTAAERMFERDKAEILGLGLDLRAETDPWDESEVHYRIARSDDAAPLDVTPAEYTVLLAASRAWDEATAGGAARRARAKLLSLGVDPDPDLERRTPRGAVESLPVLGPLLEAVTSARTVAFRYRAATGSVADRRVEPWTVGVVDGRWYVLAHDLDRGAPRLFRASRIESFPKVGGPSTHPRDAGTTLAEAIARSGGGADERADTVLDIAPFKALAVRDAAGADVAARRVDLPGTSRREARATVLGAARWITLVEPSSWRAELADVLARIERVHSVPAADLAALRAGSSARRHVSIRTPSSSADHLSRLMAEAAYVLSRGGASLTAMAEEFGIGTDALVDDLQVLFVCGDLGTGWEDLIDVEWEDGWVHVRNADALDGPLRLTPSEAIALLAGLAALSPASGEEADVIEGARAKLAGLTRPTGESDAAADAEADPDTDQAAGAAHGIATVDADDSESPRVTAASHVGRTRGERVVRALQEALARDEDVVLRYSPPDREETSVRGVRPQALETTAGRAYLRAHDASVDDERRFRVDRIVEILPPGTPLDPHPAVEPAPPARARAVWLALEPTAAWIAEAFDAAEIRDLDPATGRSGVLVRLADPVRAALVDAVLEAQGAAEVLEPAALRDQIVMVARDAASRHRPCEPVG